MSKAAGTFLPTLRTARERNQSALCVGLDPDPALLPARYSGVAGVLAFLKEVVEATADLVCAYKPNLAFFERYGADGWRMLEEIIAYIPQAVPVIADGKRGDIGSTSAAYADALFGHLGVAACTANPYLGTDAIRPLLDRHEAFTFVLCRTSNPGAAALQDLDAGGRPVYAHVLTLFQPWIAAGSAGIVIGAQAEAAFRWAATIVPQACILIPGLGAQGGTPAQVAAALTPDQRASVVVSASRSVIHAGGESADVGRAARRAAAEARQALQAALSEDQGQ